jgi:hypothetical protein
MRSAAVIPRSLPHQVFAIEAVKGQELPHALQQIRRNLTGIFGYAAFSTRNSISLRSIPKSIGLVSSDSAPFSRALRLVSASP